MDTALFKAIGIGITVFLVTMGMFWGIARFFDRPMFLIPLPPGAETTVEQNEEV